ncbi:MAG: hypothetical protein Q8O43_10665 [Dehalococcoidia bacterium]|nr:hypothetical protein [Dehalococcoidia bacterium]
MRVRLRTVSTWVIRQKCRIRGRHTSTILSPSTEKHAHEKEMDPITDEIMQLSEIIAESVANNQRKASHRIWVLPKPIRMAIITGIIAVFSIGTAGICFAIAQPSNVMASPFKGAAVLTLEASSSAIGLIEDIRGVAAGYEHSIIQTSVQSMRIIDGVKDIPSVTTPTNDMAYFPSREHPLFPEFLDRRYSQFKYTLDNYGNVMVDTSTATTDNLLKRIKQLISQLEE